MCKMFSQCNTCSMVIYQAYDTIYIKGSVATSRAMPTPFYLSIMKPVSFGSFGFMYIYEFITNILMHSRKISFQNTLNNMHADTLEAEPFALSREVVLYKTN